MDLACCSRLRDLLCRGGGPRLYTYLNTMHLVCTLFLMLAHSPLAAAQHLPAPGAPAFEPANASHLPAPARPLGHRPTTHRHCRRLSCRQAAVWHADRAAAQRHPHPGDHRPALPAGALGGGSRAAVAAQRAAHQHTGVSRPGRGIPVRHHAAHVCRRVQGLARMGLVWAGWQTASACALCCPTLAWQEQPGRLWHVYMVQSRTGMVVGPASGGMHAAVQFAWLCV